GRDQVIPNLSRRPAAAEEEEDDSGRRRGAPGSKAPAPAKAPAVRAKVDDKRRGGKLSVVTALDEEERVRSVASYRRHVQRVHRAQMGQRDQGPPQKVIREVIIPEAITVQELANRMATRSVDIIKTLMKQG
ncbi:MAG TPA: translation initiation factor IF-2, partial [Alphaproteobacteria bacterium]|nr:translation initiation factor IF-2 [Alphaproteobacteria bacterium]